MGVSGKEALLKFADVTRDFVLKDPALSSILYHLNEYSEDDAINKEILNIIQLGEKLNLKTTSTISAHALIGAVLGYVFWINHHHFLMKVKMRPIVIIMK